MTFEELEKLDFNNNDRKDAVIICFGKFNGLDEIHRLESDLYENIPENIGKHDGHEVNMDDTDGRFFTYGNNAEELFNVMKPLLIRYKFLNDAHVYLEFTKNNKIISEIDFNINECK
ncbi:hypothetical protein [Bizionia arctica]|uniref:Uncharacterized protein n=1 Tax=Bizionia arctica TaxID=1495645 RepID=A0A917GKQ5_9FLAO|nr:hypothetical protein [Bizionia arctica]GGG49968.1 hypothetical protein GCM10010976_21600 [Bizionia arctica]